MSRLAIDGGNPVRTKPWPIWPVFGDEERSRLLAVFESGKWFYGERVQEFENAFAAAHDARFGITATSGTTALEAALIGLGVGPGDEVIVPPYSFIATASCVLKVGALPVFADVILDTLNLDPDDVRRRITRRTKAIIPVHFAGLPCDMDRLGEIAAEHDLRILEDACHSWGSRWKGKGIGAIGDCGAFSFQMSKNMTAGEGGIVITDREDLADTIRSYTNVGRGKDTPWYYHRLLGSNLRLTELQAAILLGQLTRLVDHTAIRQENARYLHGKLDELPGVYHQAEDERADPRAYHLYTVRVSRDELGITRDQMVDALRSEGIPCSPGYPHTLYRNPVFQELGMGSVTCPNAELLARDLVWFGHSTLLAEREDMDDIARGFEKVIEHRDTLRGVTT